MPNYNSKGCNNPNWKGGISSIKIADDLLGMSDAVRTEVKRRFLLQVEEDVGTWCWDWTGGVFSKNGRAKMLLGGNLLASRVAYVLYKGSTNGLFVCHTCDNILCVNPEHLFLGTPAENSADMVRKGRSLDQTGSLNHFAKLNETSVAEIKAELRAGRSQRRIAEERGVVFQAINVIAMGKTWRHVQ